MWTRETYQIATADEKLALAIARRSGMTTPAHVYLVYFADEYGPNHIAATFDPAKLPDLVRDVAKKQSIDGQEELSELANIMASFPLAPGSKWQLSSCFDSIELAVVGIS